MLAELALALAQQTWIVDDDSSDPTVLNDLQLAVDTAAPGDTIFVREGVYPPSGGAATGLRIDKPLEVVGVPDALGREPRIFGSVVVDSVAQGRVLLSRIAPALGNTGIEVRSSSASVQLQDLRFDRLEVFDSDAVQVLRSSLDFVAVERSFLAAWRLDASSTAKGTEGLRATDSTVSLANSTVVGGQGGVSETPILGCLVGQPGRAGLVANGSQIYLSDTSPEGGPGGDDVDLGSFGSCDGSGATGLAILTDAASTVTAFPTTGLPHRLLVPEPVDGAGPVDLTAEGDPGDLAVLLFAANSQPLLLTPWNGVLSPSAVGLQVLVLGTVQPDGQLQVSLPASLPAGAAQAVRFAQAAFVDPLDPAFDLLGEPAVVRLLDPAIPIADCNDNGVSDALEFPGGLPDCDGNGILDACDIALGTALDCNANGIPDACDLAAGTSLDGNGDGIPDECQTLAVPGQYPDLASAFAAAPPVAEIVVAPGYYTGPGFRNLQVPQGSDWTLRGEPGQTLGTVIDAQLGGRILLVDRAELRVSNLTFAGGRPGADQGPEGGAILFLESPVHIVRCRFAFNFVTQVTGDGAAVAQELNSPLDVAPAVRIVDTEFFRNSTNRHGGALHLDHRVGASQGQLLPVQTAVLDRCVFSGNGGFDVPPPFADPATQRGGACDFRGLRALVSNSLFENNFTQGTGGAIAAERCELRLQGVTCVDNRGSRADHVQVSGAPAVPSVALLRNSLFAFANLLPQAPESLLLQNLPGDVAHCLLAGGTADLVLEQGATATLGPGLLSGQAGFVDAAGFDFHLSVGSQSVHAGDPGFVPAPGETDLDGLPRLVGPAVDLGAYERQ